jgi:membrane-associated phospholipid phosphatase
MSGAPQPRPTSSVLRRVNSTLGELASVDQAVYAAIAGTETPTLDRAMRRLSGAADYSKLSLAASLVLALGGGARGRRAAISGLASVAVTATVVNTVIKPLARRRRPDRDAGEVPLNRHVQMPGSRSFPSGHTAAAVAFAHGVAWVIPWAGVPLYLLAAAVGYSRVHTGVHYPGDVLGGAVLGAMISDATAGSLARRTAGHSSASTS